jgi:DNA polymerase
MTGVEIDFETRSDVDLKRHGAFVYFESPNTSVLIGSYRIDNGPIRRWQRGEPCPADLRAAIEAGATISAHNAAFEILCFRWLAATRRLARCPSRAVPLHRRNGRRDGPPPLARRPRRSPRALRPEGQRGHAPHQQILEAAQARADENPPGLYWNEPEDHPADWALFKRVLRPDVETEAAAAPAGAALRRRAGTSG